MLKDGIAYAPLRNLPEKEWEKKKKEIRAFRNCAKCNRRLVINLCHYHEEDYYCFKCCPGHKWQSDYDWAPECARCGIDYTLYLEQILESYKVPYLKRKP